MQFKRTYTEQELIKAVKRSTCWKDVIERLGLVSSPATKKRILETVQQLGLDTNHLARRPSILIRKWTKEQFEQAAKESINFAEIARYLGVVPRGDNYLTFKKVAKIWDVDLSHLTGRSRIHIKDRNTTKRNLSDILVKESSYPSYMLRPRLIKEGLLRNECVICKIVDWQAMPITLHLDHINGDHSDNRLENLRILCPNCHSQTPTYGSKSRSPKQPKLPVVHPTPKEIQSQQAKRKVKDRPTLDQLKQMVAEEGYEAIGRKYNVTGAAVKRWIVKPNPHIDS